MNKQSAWDIFEKSGKIEDYLIYKNITDSALENEYNKVKNNGKNENIDGRTDNQRTEYW